MVFREHSAIVASRTVMKACACACAVLAQIVRKIGNLGMHV